MKSGRRRRKFLMVLPFAILFMACVSVGCVSGATPPEEAWNMTFGGPDRDVARSVQQTADGGYILAGGTYSFETGRSDARIVKTDSVGNELWNKTFGGANHDWAISVQQTVDGGYILAGGTDSYGAGRSDAWLIKTDSVGNELWNKTFGGTDGDWAISIQHTTDGGYILAGYTRSYGAGSSDMWLLKTDSKGREQWNKTFGGAGSDVAFSVQHTTDGGYIIAGYTRSYVAGYGSDMWLVKTDSKGREQWNKTFGGPGLDGASYVQQTTDGGYIIAGDLELYGVNSKPDAWLVKTDSAGNEQWNMTFGGPDWDRASSAQQTADGGYIVAGETESYVVDTADAWLLKIDSSGTALWNKTFGGTELDGANAVRQTADGGYILAGSTESYDANDRDFWLVKVNEELKESPVELAKPPIEPTAPISTASLIELKASAVESRENQTQIPRFKIMGVLLGLIMSAVLVTLRKKNKK